MFQQLGSVAALPQVAQDILAVAQDPNAGVIDLLPAVEKDPGLAANIVKTANSSYYAPRQPIGDLQTALSMLGMDRARNLAMTVVVGDRFTEPSPIGEIDRHRLWDHSVCTAAAARTLAKHTGTADPEEAYLAGLIHDLGLLVIDQHLVEQLPRLLVRLRTGGDWVAAEHEIFSFDHAQLGAYLAWRSGFPDQIVEAVDLHHESNRASGEVAYLVSVVAVANYFVTRMGRGSIAARRLEAPSQTVFDRLELDRPALRNVWALIEEQLAHVGGLTESLG
ncbi:MAG: HDOD domain-containing protein [Planctomycetota bacterium]